MKRSFFVALLPMTSLLFCGVGCEDGYSADVVYHLREDPIRMPANKIGIEPTEPDQPGQLPLLSIKDFDDKRNPFFASNKKLMEESKDNDLVRAGIFRDPTQVSSAERAQMKAVLDELFGTPSHPRIGDVKDTETVNIVNNLGIKGEAQLAEGSRLYRLHCVHCHGVAGDGRGPTARWVNPHPRDYRQSRFKFQSVDQTSGERPPLRQDLLRILENGVESTAMPSFVLLPIEQREALVTYVIHLSIRGRTEFDTFVQSFEYDRKKNSLTLKSDEGSVKKAVKSWFAQSLKQWKDAQSAPIIPVPYPDNIDPDPSDKVKFENFKASVKRGHELFKTGPPQVKKADEKKVAESSACLSCHIKYGREAKFREDDWGTFSRPNNLTLGVYRGGRRPVDLYYRIHSGIQPSGMIAFGSSFSGQQIWDLVNFVQVLGTPTMRKEMGISLD